MKKKDVQNERNIFLKINKIELLSSIPKTERAINIIKATIGIKNNF